MAPDDGCRQTLPAMPRGRRQVETRQDPHQVTASQLDDLPYPDHWGLFHTALAAPHPEPTTLQDTSPTTKPPLLGRTGKTCFR